MVPCCAVVCVLQPDPACRSVEYSFAQEPEFDIRASPIGYAAFGGDLPGLVSGLRAQLLKVGGEAGQCRAASAGTQILRWGSMGATQPLAATCPASSAA